MKVGRNDLCPCGNGKKYKKCCMQSDMNASREVQQIGSTSEWVQYYLGKMSGPVLTEARAAAAVQASSQQWCQGSSSNADDLTFVQHALYDLAITDAGPFIMQSALVIPNTDTSKCVDLKTNLAASHVSLLEVIANKRDRGVRLKDHLTGTEVFVRDTKLASSLEPLEVVLGRVIPWDDEMVLLPGWEKVRFRGRKAAIAAVLAKMDDAGLEEDDTEFRVAWLRREAANTVRSAREA